MKLKSLPVCLSLSAGLLLTQQNSLWAQDREDFDSPPKERISDADKIYSERHATIKKLLAAMKDYEGDNSYSGPFNQAICGLANLRAKEGVKPIAQHISFFPFRTFRDPRYTVSPDSYPTEIYYPCASALREIGEPSDLKKELLQLIGGSDDELERALACWVLMESYGKDTALQMVDNKAKGSYDSNESRYAWCVDYIQTYQISLGLPDGSPRPNGYIGGSLQQVLARKLAAVRNAAPR